MLVLDQSPYIGWFLEENKNKNIVERSYNPLRTFARTNNEDRLGDCPANLNDTIFDRLIQQLENADTSMECVVETNNP